MSLFSAPNVDRLIARGDVEGLTKAARYKKDPALAERAREALTDKIDYLISQLDTRNLRRLVMVREALVAAGKPAVKAMIFVHTDKQSVHRRQDVTYVLGEAGDPEAVPVLIDALRDTDPLLRQLAAEALGKIGDEQAAEPLRLAALRDDNERVRRAATKAHQRLVPAS